MPYFNYILLFVAGFAEFIIRVVDYKAIQRSKCFYSSIITFLNIWVWFYILASIVNNLQNVPLIFVYALGCAVGNYVMLKLDDWLDKHIIGKSKNEIEDYKYKNWIDFSR